MKTPPNNYAPFWSRILAHNIDLLVFLVLAYGVSLLITSDRILFLTLLTLYIIYNSVLEVSKWKGSIGKKLVGIEVLTLHGEKLDLSKALARNVMKVISVSIAFGGIIMILIDKKRQSLHDKLTGSAVFLV